MTSRYELYNKINNENDIEFFDIFSVNWGEFEWRDSPSYHKLDFYSIIHPEMISLMYYGTDKYEDLLFLLNSIEDPFSLEPGFLMQIPSLSDINNFYRKIKGI